MVLLEPLPRREGEYPRIVCSPDIPPLLVVFGLFWQVRACLPLFIVPWPVEALVQGPVLIPVTWIWIMLRWRASLLFSQSPLSHPEPLTAAYSGRSTVSWSMWLGKLGQTPLNAQCCPPSPLAPSTLSPLLPSLFWLPPSASAQPHRLLSPKEVENSLPIISSQGRQLVTQKNTPLVWPAGSDSRGNGTVRAYCSDIKRREQLQAGE